MAPIEILLSCWRRSGIFMACPTGPNSHSLWIECEYNGQSILLGGCTYRSIPSVQLQQHSYCFPSFPLFSDLASRFAYFFPRVNNTVIIQAGLKILFCNKGKSSFLMVNTVLSNHFPCLVHYISHLFLVRTSLLWCWDDRVAMFSLNALYSDGIIWFRSTPVHVFALIQVWDPSEYKDRY